ncbi:hypothetical protein CUMW_161450, partial [Citrus unshiu]
RKGKNETSDRENKEAIKRTNFKHRKQLFNHHNLRFLRFKASGSSSLEWAIASVSSGKLRSDTAYS